MIILRRKSFAVLDANKIAKAGSAAVREAGRPEHLKKWNVVLLRGPKKRLFSKVDNREDVPEDIMEKVERTGVIQQDREGKWRIINKKKKKFWDVHFDSKESAQRGLRGFFHAKH